MVIPQFYFIKSPEDFTFGPNHLQYKKQTPSVSRLTSECTYLENYYVKPLRSAIKDTHKEKAQSNKTPVLTSSRIWAFRPLIHQINSL